MNVDITQRQTFFRKRAIIETVNGELKNIAQVKHYISLLCEQWP